MKSPLRWLALSYVLLVFTSSLFWYLGQEFSAIRATAQDILMTPTVYHPFGTDALGREIIFRILEGGFVSFTMVFCSSLGSMILAVFVGVVGTWYFPKNQITLLILDILQALPSYIVSTLVFLVVQSFTSSPIGTLFALGTSLALTHWMNPARVLRAQTLQLLHSPFVEASKALGATWFHILKVHVPSHLRNSFFVLWALQLPIFLMYESFMSFIGFGVESPYTSWGLLLQEGWKYLSDYPHLLLGPGFVLFTVLLCFNYLLDLYKYQGLPESKIEPPNADSKATAAEIVR